MQIQSEWLPGNAECWHTFTLCDFSFSPVTLLERSRALRLDAKGGPIALFSLRPLRVVAGFWLAAADGFRSGKEGLDEIGLEDTSTGRERAFFKRESAPATCLPLSFSAGGCCRV